MKKHKISSYLLDNFLYELRKRSLIYSNKQGGFLNIYDLETIKNLQLDVNYFHLQMIEIQEQARTILFK